PGGKPLMDLLNVPPGEELTFFNLQKYLKIHYPQSSKEVKEPKEVKAPKEDAKEAVTAPKKKAAAPAAAPAASATSADEVPVEEVNKPVRKRKIVGTT